MYRASRNQLRGRRWGKQRGRQAIQSCNACSSCPPTGALPIHHLGVPTSDFQKYWHELGAAFFKIHIRGLPPDATEHQVVKWCLETLGDCLDPRLAGEGTEVVRVERLYDATPNEQFKKADIRLSDVAFKDSLIRSRTLIGVDNRSTHLVRLWLYLSHHVY